MIILVFFHVLMSLHYLGEYVAVDPVT